MYLTDEEKRMLDGEQGYGVQKGMQLMVGLGEAMEAEKLIPVTNVHLGGLSIRSSEDAGYLFYKDLADRGAKFKITPTTNVLSGDFELWTSMGLSAAERQRQYELIDAFARMGALRTQTCTPYLLGNVPRFGETCSWMETSAIAFINSILGAHTNREAGAAACAAALTGRTPYFGYHMPENRIGSVLVHVEKKGLNSIYDAGNLGFYFGRFSGYGNVVLDGIDEHIDNRFYVQLAGAASTAGDVAMFHIVGVTPEAPDLKTAFGGKKPVIEVSYGEKEEKEVIEYLNTANDTDEVNWVYMGCPMLQYEDLMDLAKEIEGKQVAPGVEFWATTAMPTKELIRRQGILQVLEDAGVNVVTDCCPILTPLGQLERMRNRGIHHVVTNSTKQCALIPGMCFMDTHYGDLEKCVEAAVTGKWR